MVASKNNTRKTSSEFHSLMRRAQVRAAALAGGRVRGMSAWLPGAVSLICKWDDDGGNLHHRGGVKTEGGGPARALRRVPDAR